ncbi:hypothetical protein FRC12_014074 [Ceratobasidium sp. 428]|nr:hypothetical protein FRC12_014074 [Ceratobasidium sp. 428]
MLYSSYIKTPLSATGRDEAHAALQYWLLVAGSGESQRGVDNGAAAIENRERKAEGGVAPGANADNAGGTGNLGADKIVDDVDKDVAANADTDVDERDGESQEDEGEGVIENNDDAVQLPYS